MNSWLKYSMGCLFVAALASCAGTDPEASTAAAEAPKSMSERLNEGGGYKQNDDGSWVPKSDKRSEYDSQRESTFFQGTVDKKEYKTGDYAKKSWWGGDNDYEKKSYAGNTDGSRFQTQANQSGQMSRSNGQKASVAVALFQQTLWTEQLLVKQAHLRSPARRMRQCNRSAANTKPHPSSTGGNNAA